MSPGPEPDAAVSLDDPDGDRLVSALALAGSAVFEMSRAPVDTSTPSWWDFRIGASWRAPLGPGSSIEGIEDHPAVHIAYADAEAYATWAGKALPS